MEERKNERERDKIREKERDMRERIDRDTGIVREKRKKEMEKEARGFNRPSIGGQGGLGWPAGDINRGEIGDVAKVQVEEMGEGRCGGE